MISRKSIDADEDTGAAAVEEPLWFTSLADFKPLTYMYHRGRFCSCFFACAHRTGEHYVLKRYEKGIIIQ